MSFPDDGREEHLDPWERRATIPIIACACASALSTSTLLTYLAISDFKAWRLTKTGRKRDSYVRQLSRAKFKNQGYFWLVNLFCADFVQSIGWALSSYNLARDRLWPGFACDVQGFFINVGDVGSSVWSLAIAIHTVLLLAGGQQTRIWAAEKSTTGNGRWILCICIWLSIIFLGLVGPVVIQKLDTTKGPFYNGASGGWCWIGKNYPLERIFFHYFFVFIDMAALTFLYCLVFFYIRSQLRKFSAETNSTTDHQGSGVELERWQADLEVGTPITETAPRQIMTTRMVSVTTEDRGTTLTTDRIEGVPISLRNTPNNQSHVLARRRMLQVARSLLWYPLVYLCVTAPLTIGRLAQFANDDWAQICVAVGATFYASAGWCNVLLYTTTRKGIIHWSWFGWNRKPQSQNPLKSKSQPLSSPRSVIHPLGDKVGSQTSMIFSGSMHSIDETIDMRSPSSHSSGSGARRAPNLLHFDGVDFSHSTGFDSVVDLTDDSKFVHDRNCIQTQLGTRPLNSVDCTCKNIPLQ